MNIYFQKTHQRSFGTYPLTGDVAKEAIQTAAEVGYRAFDTAQMYQNEAETGEALKATGIDRADLCITTKVDPGNFGEDRFIPSVEQSLRDLNVDYVDVLLAGTSCPPCVFSRTACGGALPGTSVCPTTMWRC